MDEDLKSMIKLIIVSLAFFLFFFGTITISFSNFMPMTQIGKVVSYSQSIDPVFKYKYTRIVMVYETLIFDNDSETPINTGERDFKYLGWHEFELGSIYRIYSEGKWYNAVPEIIEVDVVV